MTRCTEIALVFRLFVIVNFPVSAKRGNYMLASELWSSDQFLGVAALQLRPIADLIHVRHDLFSYRLVLYAREQARYIAY